MDERVAAFAAALRALCHDALGRLPEEPDLHAKRVLAEQALEDAATAVALEGVPGTVRAQPDRTALKAALAAAARRQARALDPLADEPRLEVLLALAHRQERHVEELPDHRGVRTGDPLALAVRPFPARPARDPFVEVADGAPDDELNAELLAAETAARVAHEQPQAPAAFQADLARIAADRMRRAAVIDAARTREGAFWGARPVDVSAFALVGVKDLGERLAFAAVPDDPAHRAIVERWAGAAVS